MKSKRSITIVFLSISFLVGVLNAPVFAERNYLFQWDEGECTAMPGWTWIDDVAFGHIGTAISAQPTIIRYGLSTGDDVRWNVDNTVITNDITRDMWEVRSATDLN